MIGFNYDQAIDRVRAAATRSSLLTSVRIPLTGAWGLVMFKRIDKLSSALASMLRVNEGEAHNQFKACRKSPTSAFCASKPSALRGSRAARRAEASEELFG